MKIVEARVHGLVFEQKSQQQQRHEATCETAQGRGNRPDRDTRAQQALWARMLHEPAGHRHERHVGIVEGRAKHSQLRGRECELILNERRRGRKVAAVDVVDKDGQRYEEDGALDVEATHPCRLERESFGRTRANMYGCRQFTAKRGHMRCCAVIGIDG